jgi:hypothetical protein
MTCDFTNSREANLTTPSTPTYHGERIVSIEMPTGSVMVKGTTGKPNSTAVVFWIGTTQTHTQFKRLWQKLTAACLIAQRDNRFWRATNG